MVMFRFSRACVQSAWMVYIAEPSAWMLSTFLSGHAIAAPVAIGMPRPIEPPMFCQPGVRMRIARRGEEGAPGRDALVHHDRVLGNQRADRLGERDQVDLAGRRRLRAVFRGLDRLLCGTELVREPFERVDQSSSMVESVVNWVSFGASRLGLSG